MCQALKRVLHVSTLKVAPTLTLVQYVQQVWPLNELA